MKKSVLSRKVASQLGGYDIFISYRHADAEVYAKELHKVLESNGLIVFRDESEVDNPGTSTEKFAKLACSSRCLVTIVTPNVYQSNSVYEELSSYLSNRIDKWYRRPFSRVISIDVEQSLSKANLNASQETPNWKRLSNFVYEAETIEAIESAIPSKEVIDRLIGASTFMNAWRRFLIFIGLIVIAAISAITGTSLYLNSLREDIGDTKKELMLISDSTKILVGRNSELQTKAGNLEKLSKKLREDSVDLAMSNEDLRSQTSQLDSTNKTLRKERETLTRQSAFLRRQADSLDKKTVMLNYRIAAMNTLESDPTKAYRLAEQAYNMDKSSTNSTLIRSAASSIDYYYKSLLENYKIIDFKEPYLLLIKTNSKEGEPNIAVYDIRSCATKFTTLNTDRIAWIIPDANSWKVLTRNWKGQSLDAVPEYQLWNASYEPISDKVYGGGMTLPNFINHHKVSIKLSRQPKTLIWDLLTGNKQYIVDDTSDKFGGYFREIYGALDTRSDGGSAAHQENGLILIDVNGKVDTSTYTQVDFDPSSFYSRAKWSPDDKFLALNYFDRKRLGIWDPVKKSFVWLDPDGWVVNSFSWSQNGHMLAFSGRTENDIDVTLEIVDASSPEKSRRIIYRGDVPIQSISFLPGDEKVVICDKESNLSIIEIATKKVVGKGQQADLVRSSPSGFYSSSVRDFKSWYTSPAPSKNWFFKSDSAKRYYPDGTVDSTNRWMAVPYFRKLDTTIGIEVRNTISNERMDLNLPYDYDHVIKFTNDGNWLIFRNSKKLYFWNTSSWREFSIEIDRTFEEFKVERNLIYASFDSAEHRVSYKFDLNGEKPKFLGRDPRLIKIKTDETEEEDLSGEIEKSIDGWKIDKLYKYRAAGWKKSGLWAIRLTCRDQSLGAKDCDVLFVPTNLTWLMEVYDRLVWKPSTHELQKLVKNKD